MLPRSRRAPVLLFAGEPQRLITDDGITTEQRQDFEKHGIEFIIA